jgi:hypothetical protein
MTIKIDEQNILAVAPRPYVKPTLVKGPILAGVTAAASKVSHGAPGGACWVARAAFGATDIRWMIFRAWLMDDAPAWFRGLYLRHGELVGTWLTDRPRARSLVRTAMMPAIRRKSFG